MNILPYDFYARDTAVVARDLLGKALVRLLGSVEYAGKIVETEAYVPFTDPASHSFIGKTPRNDVMFGEAGVTYVYSIHQVFCLNIVTEGVGSPGAVLIRAVEPIAEIDQMKVNRKTDELVKLTSGPGKLCQAMQITRADNGKSVCDSYSDIYVVNGESVRSEEIVATPRVGISKAVDLPLRFYIRDNPFVSR